MATQTTTQYEEVASDIIVVLKQLLVLDKKEQDLSSQVLDKQRVPLKHLVGIDQRKVKDLLAQAERKGYK